MVTPVLARLKQHFDDERAGRFMGQDLPSDIANSPIPRAGLAALSALGLLTEGLNNAARTSTGAAEMALGGTNPLAATAGNAALGPFGPLWQSLRDSGILNRGPGRALGEIVADTQRGFTESDPRQSILQRLMQANDTGAYRHKYTQGGINAVMDPSNLLLFAGPVAAAADKGSTLYKVARAAQLYNDWNAFGIDKGLGKLGGAGLKRLGVATENGLSPATRTFLRDRAGGAALGALTTTANAQLYNQGTGNDVDLKGAALAGALGGGVLGSKRIGSVADRALGPQEGGFIARRLAAQAAKAGGAAGENGIDTQRAAMLRWLTGDGEGLLHAGISPERRASLLDIAPDLDAQLRGFARNPESFDPVRFRSEALANEAANDLGDFFASNLPRLQAGNLSRDELLAAIFPTRLSIRRGPIGEKGIAKVTSAYPELGAQMEAARIAGGADAGKVRPEDVAAIMLRQTDEGRAIAAAIKNGDHGGLARALERFKAVWPGSLMGHEQATFHDAAYKLGAQTDFINARASHGASPGALADELVAGGPDVPRMVGIGQGKVPFQLWQIGAGQGRPTFDSKVIAALKEGATPASYRALLEQLYPWINGDMGKAHQLFWDAAQPDAAGVGAQTAHTGLRGLQEAVRGGEKLGAGINPGGVADSLGALRDRLLGGGVRDLPPGTLQGEKPLGDNFVRPLGDITDRLYHETDIEQALGWIDPQTSAERREVFFANTPDMALGQGGKGVLIELDPAGVEGQVNRSKPAWQPAWDAGQAEFIAKRTSPSGLRDNVRSVTVMADAKAPKAYLLRFRRTLAGLEAQGWTKQEIDGGMRYLAPNVAQTGAGDTFTELGAGLSPKAITNAIRGAGAAPLAGAALGGAAGFATDDEDRTGGALKGAIGGAIGGVALAHLAPELGRAVSTAYSKAAPGLLDDTIASPQALSIAHAMGVKAQEAGAQAPGAKLTELPRQVDDAWRAQVVNTFRGLALDASSLWLLVKDFGRDYGVDRLDVKRTLGKLVANFNQPDPIDRLGDLGTTLHGWGLEDFVDKSTSLDQVLGTSFSQADIGTNKMSTPQRFLTGVGLSFTNLREAMVPVVGPLIGGMRQVYAPYVDAAYHTLNGFQHAAPRITFWDAALTRELPQAANKFRAAIAPTGIDLAPLFAGGKAVRPDDVSKYLAATYKGLTADEVEQIAQLYKDELNTTAMESADRIAHIFGDFRDKANKPWKTFLGRVFPFSRYAMQFAPVGLEMAKRHPVIAGAAAVGTIASAAAVAKNDEAPWNAGTVPISTETPVLGALARLRLGGQQGTVRIDPLNNFTGPIGGDTFAMGGGLPTDTPYDQAKGLLGRIGFSPHPALDSLASVVGATNRNPGPASRTAPIEQAAELIPGMPEVPSIQGPFNAVKSQLTGKSVDDYDAVARRYAELVYAETGHPMSDNRNLPYEERMGDIEDPLWARARQEVRLANLVGSLTSNLTPVTNTATGAGAERVSQGYAQRPTDEELLRLAETDPDAARVKLWERDIADRFNPVTRTYQDANTNDRNRKVIKNWGPFASNPAVRDELLKQQEALYRRKDRP